MGKIIHSKIMSDKKVVYKIELEEEEALKLQGHLKNIYAFTSNLCTTKTQINSRGNGGVTKYFKIPLEIRPKKKYYKKLSCHKLETPSKIFYIYTVYKKK